MRELTRKTGSVLKETLSKCLEDGVVSRGAALSYYVLLSLGPLLALLLFVLSFVFADAPVQAVVLEQIETYLGGRAADIAGTVMGRVRRPELVSPASVLTILALLFGATAAFANIRGSLNAIWGVAPPATSYREHVLGFFLTRARATVMLAVTGVIVTASFVITTAWSVLVPVLSDRLPLEPLLLAGADLAVSVLVMGLLFAALFRTLPAVRIEWSSVWLGAFLTAALFVFFKTLIGRLIAGSVWTGYYGPGAAVVAFLLWVFLSAQIFYFGAEFTHVWSRRHDGALAPDEPAGDPPPARDPTTYS